MTPAWAEVERLEAENEDLTHRATMAERERDHLKTEVKRLTAELAEHRARHARADRAWDTIRRRS